MNREPIKIIGDILVNCMTLDSQQIIIYNQDFKVPETSDLFIVLQYSSSPNVLYNTNQFLPADEGVEGAQQNLSMLAKENYIINVLSKNDESRLRKEEVILSLNSDFSRNQQELYQFQIARLSNSFTNVSELEGAGMLNRFALNISLTAHYSKTVPTVYYDDFTNQINIE